ncbi:MAG: hypothetical protein Q9169_007532 [Polycauliona sp. 2 TL-2023]
MPLCDETCPIRNYRTEYTVNDLIADHEKPRLPRHKPSTTDVLPIWTRRLRPTQIRLLRIEPGDVGVPIVTSLRIANMTFYDGVELDDTKESITYEALSYSWGLSLETSSISCNGNIIPVRTTLYNALIHLRLADRPRYIWIDALCINQADNEEKSVQVFRMSSVYYKAEKVIAYLGKTYDCSEAALQLLADVDLDKTHTGICHEGFKHLLLSLQLLLEAPWFTRTWVRQEVFMANSLDVQIGFVSLAWQKFVTNATALLKEGRSLFLATDDSDQYDSDESDSHKKDIYRYHLLTQIPASLRLLHQGNVEDKANVLFEAVHRSGSHGRDLGAVLRGSVHFKASDPRDFVYGVASMTSAKFDHPCSSLNPKSLKDASIKIDYQLSVENLYENTTVYLMHTSGCLDPMFFACDTRRQSRLEESFATWCPDWSLLPEKTILDVLWATIEQRYEALSLDMNRGNQHKSDQQKQTASSALSIAERRRAEDCLELHPPGELVCSGLILGHLIKNLATLGDHGDEGVYPYADVWQKQELRRDYEWLKQQLGSAYVPVKLAARGLEAAREHEELSTCRTVDLFDMG